MQVINWIITDLHSLHQHPVNVSTIPFSLWLNFTVQQSEKIVSISRALCLHDWSLSGMAACQWSIHWYPVGRCTHTLVIHFVVHVLISTHVWRHLNFLDVRCGFLNLDHSIWWRTTCMLGMLLLTVQPFAGMYTFMITLRLCLIFNRWLWMSLLSFQLWGFISGFLWAGPFIEWECDSFLCWPSHTIRFTGHSGSADHQHQDSLRGSSGKLAEERTFHWKFILLAACTTHCGLEYLIQLIPNGLNQSSMVLTQSATTHKTICNWSWMVSVQSHSKW